MPSKELLHSLCGYLGVSQQGFRHDLGPTTRGTARILHELLSRDRVDECATGQPQGIGSEAYLNSTSQGPIPEDARKDAQLSGHSRQFVKYASKKKPFITEGLSFARFQNLEVGIDLL
jgi:hypothetical protein